MSVSDSSDVQAAAQHYLVCGIEDCQQNGQYYCNICHLPLCEKCRHEHRKNADTKIHEVVLYRQRKRQLPVEKCNLHPTKNIDIHCRECKTRLCSKCSTMQVHQGHIFDDLEEIYGKKIALCQTKIFKIREYFLPTSKDLKTDIKEDAIEVTVVMESIRASMKTDAETLKELIDTMTLENIEQTNIIEKSLLEMLNSQETTYDKYIAYLENLLQGLHSCLPAKNFKRVFCEKFENLKISAIPETTMPLHPVFTMAQYKKDDIAKLLGKVNVPITKPVQRKIKPFETASMKLRFPEIHTKQGVKKLTVKQKFSLLPLVIKLMECKVPSVDNACHVSVDKSGRLWVSDWSGNLVQTDLQGNQLQKIKTSGGSEGYNTVTQNGNLIYTDKRKNVINVLTQDNIVSEFINTGKWTPLSIHSSRIDGDILVGMIKDGEAKVTRFNWAGKEMQNIQRDIKGHHLYSDPRYITENFNGDICTSDFNKQAVVVVNKSGQHAFSYRGQRSAFLPFGICTDVLGHILLCDAMSESVHLLNQYGEFLSIILSPKEVVSPCGVCVDERDNLYVGQLTKTVTVYKYLQC